jgi:hypothetical protein
MPRCLYVLLGIVSIALTGATPVSAQPAFVNGIVIAGSRLDATRQPGANGGRFGFFSDIYYDSSTNEWWALSDRGPGGGLISYGTRVQRFSIDINPITGAISHFRVLETVKFTDPKGLLPGNSKALNGLNPFDLNGFEGTLGRSFDPEGLVIDPRTGNFLIADEYGPSLYAFDRKGRLVKVFDTPINLIPRAGGAVNYVALRDACGGSVPVPLCGANEGRQDNRGYEGLAISPDGSRLFAVLQDPLINEPGPNNGRTGRNVRILVFDNDRHSQTYRESLVQYVYQLEPQADVAARINLLKPGDATATDPRQGRNIGVSAIHAINDTQFLVLERDNRGIGVDDPAGARAVGSKRVYKIDISTATDVTTMPLGADALPDGVVAVTKSPVFIDISANTLLPGDKQAEKWEGMAVGPELRGGRRLILLGNDNDYSVTQTGAGEQFDVYVDFAGNFARCVLDDPTQCEVNPSADDLVIDNPVAIPRNFSLLPGVLHAYRASQADLAGYEEPRKPRRHHDDDDDQHGHDEHDNDRHNGPGGH